MACSPARLAANRRNAQLGGPKTEAGKARSRANAMTHGLTATALRTPDEQAAVEAAPTGSASDWLDEEAVILRARIRRAHLAEERERENAAIREKSCWDEDRAREADRIGIGLARRPDRVVRTLRATVQGCDWLIERWGRLQIAAGQEGGWSADQQALADDLRGLAEERRGTPVEPGRQAAMASEEIRDLEALRGLLQPSDAFQRQTVQLGLDDGATLALRRVTRYEAALFRRLRWCVEQKQPEPPPKPAPAPPPTREPRPAPGRTTPPEIDLGEPFDDDLMDALMADFAARSGPIHPIAMIPPGIRSPHRR